MCCVSLVSFYVVVFVSCVALCCVVHVVSVVLMCERKERKEGNGDHAAAVVEYQI